MLTNNGDIVLWSTVTTLEEDSIVLGDNNVLNRQMVKWRHGLEVRLPLPEAADMGRVRRDTVHRQPSRIKLGTSTANHTEILGGGDIIVKGSSTATGQADDQISQVFISEFK